MSPAEDLVMAYRGGGPTATVLASDLDSLWAELRSGGKLRTDAIEAGLDPKSLSDLLEHPRAEVFALEKRGVGLDPIATAILVKVVIPVAGAVAVDLWKKVLLPRIERARGAKLPPVDR